jgi:apolipoprotein N-acyltransferase
MVRITNTGTTAVIDHQGRVLSRLPTWTRDVLHTQVTGRNGPPTLYVRWVSSWGLWPLWVLGWCLLLFVRVRRR